MAAWVLHDAQRRDRPHGFGVETEFLADLGQQLATVVHRAVRAPRARIHAARRAELPHSGLIHGGARTAADRDPIPAGQHPAHREGPHAQGREQGVVLGLRDQAAVFGQVAGDALRRQRVDGEYLAVEQPSGAPGLDPRRRRFPQGVDAGLQRVRQRGHGARDVDRDVRADEMHEERGHAAHLISDARRRGKTPARRGGRASSPRRAGKAIETRAPPGPCPLSRRHGFPRRRERATLGFLACQELAP